MTAVAFAAFLMAGVAQAAIKTQTVDYKQGDTTLEGTLVWDDAAQGKRPGVLVFHAYMGASDFEVERAKRLAEMGYVAFVADVYGKGVRPATPAEAGAQSRKMLDDRALLRARSTAAYDQLKANPNVDAARIASIGFCFGGASALELARTGAPIVGTVTFHGNLANPTPADAKNIKGHVLTLHGADDPSVGPPIVDAYRAEMKAAAVDFEFVSYSGTVHAFTDKRAGTDNSKGAAYNEKSDRRSWIAMQDFFKEIFASK